MKNGWSAIVEVEFTVHRERHRGVRIIRIHGKFADAASAEAHFRPRRGKVLLIVPSGDAHRVVSESNLRLIPGDGAP